MNAMSSRTSSRAYLYWAIILAVILGAWALRLTVITPLRVISSQMSPTLLSGDFALGWKNMAIHRGDVVWLQSAEPAEMARVIGLPGDFVELTGCELSINGGKARYQLSQDHPFIRRETIGEKSWSIACSPENALILSGQRVPEDSYLLLPDARIDGFAAGNQIVPQDKVAGRVLGVWFSLTPQKEVRFYRLFLSVY